jgi:putative inorganic carbon (hco3(-)) transporter
MDHSEPIDKNKLVWFYGAGTVFILLNAIFTFNEVFWFAVLPFALFLFFYLFVSIDKVLWFIVFTTPLAINVTLKDFGLSISLPTEPLMISILGVFFLKIFHRSSFERDFFYHPVSIAIFIHLLWMFITSLTSSLPMVSFKFLLSRLWFIVSFYYFGFYLFKQEKNIQRFVWAYCVPFAIVIVYTLKMHSDFGFTVQAANWVMSPFYNDHTAYGAMLCFFIPALAGVILTRKNSLLIKSLSLFMLMFFLLALVLSYSRAAWVSLAGALGVWFIMYFKINIKLIAFASVAALFFFFAFKDQVLMKLEKNRQDSSTNIGEHVQSISNISSDASNLERLNRWSSALRMFKERPFLGWGPGTYSFKYAPFQFSYEKTIISTNAGDKGNAHSEYIGPLAESGVLGCLTFLGIVFSILYTGTRLFKRLPKNATRVTVIALTMGLVTYFLHGLLNNFLDTDKASVPFWAFIAALVALDIANKNEESVDVKTQ